MTADPTAWLLDQITEDRKRANAADRPRLLDAIRLPRRWREFFLTWSPAHMRDECASKRRIVEISAATVRNHGLCTRCVTCLTVRELTQPYADRAGYREEWKPEAGS